MEVIEFAGLSVGTIKIPKNLVTKERLTQLFALDSEAIVVDNETGEEFEDFSQFEASKLYTVVCEEDMADDSPFQKDPSRISLEERKHLFIKRQKRLLAMELARKQLIHESYVPRHPELFTFSTDFLHPTLKQALETNQLPSILKQLTDTKIFSFPCFTKHFCELLIDEVEYFETLGYPVTRPNSMNNYGLILDEIGFTPFLSELRKRVVEPLARLHYAPYGGEDLDHHHGFIVQYRMNEDLSLNFHFDDAEVTINVCLGKVFTGGSLYFSGYIFDPSTHNENITIEHHPGVALLHLGKHRHGAKAITSGDRYNLILWCRNSQYRESQESTCSCCRDHAHSHDDDGDDGDHHHH